MRPEGSGWGGGVEGTYAARRGSPPPWTPDFVRVWAGSAISTVGTRTLGVVYPLLALSVTGSPAAAGWTGFALTLPILILYVPGGILVDRIPPRSIVLFAESVRGLTVVSVCVALLFSGHVWLPHVILAALVEGAMWVLYMLAEMSLVPSLVERTGLRYALARTESASHLASLAGKPLGGYLFGLGYLMPFAVNAVLFAVSFLLFLGMREGPSRLPVRPPWRRDLLAGFRALRHQPFLRASVALIAITNLMVNTMIMIFVAGSSGLTSLTVGLVLASAGVGGAVGAALTPYLRRPMRSILLVHMWVWVAALCTAALGAMLEIRAVFFAVALFITGFGGAVSNVCIRAIEVECIPPKTLARVVGVSRLTSHGAICLAAPLGGFLVTWFGVAGGSFVLLLAMLGVAVPATRLRVLRAYLVPVSPGSTA
ncbi:MFS transporter [Nonomuraea sp. NPDC050786]|uniref:MFS transporter n=1 Tax=Nonomuraea sp. NPDC050786 TaxID=3154840 RepID=UPI00340F112C